MKDHGDVIAERLTQLGFSQYEARTYIGLLQANGATGYSVANEGSAAGAGVRIVAVRHGVPLLGINGSAIISHGRSNAKAIKNALRVARQTAESDVAGTIASGLAKLGAGASAESV